MDLNNLNLNTEMQLGKLTDGAFSRTSTLITSCPSEYAASVVLGVLVGLWITGTVVAVGRALVEA